MGINVFIWSISLALLLPGCFLVMFAETLNGGKALVGYLLIAVGTVFFAEHVWRALGQPAKKPFIRFALFAAPATVALLVRFGIGP